MPFEKYAKVSSYEEVSKDQILKTSTDNQRVEDNEEQEDEEINVSSQAGQIS